MGDFPQIAVRETSNSWFRIFDVGGLEPIQFHHFRQVSSGAPFISTSGELVLRRFVGGGRDRLEKWDVWGNLVWEFEEGSTEESSTTISNARPPSGLGAPYNSTDLIYCTSFESGVLSDVVALDYDTGAPVYRFARSGTDIRITQDSVWIQSLGTVRRYDRLTGSLEFEKVTMDGGYTATMPNVAVPESEDFLHIATRLEGTTIGFQYRRLNKAGDIVDAWDYTSGKQVRMIAPVPGTDDEIFQVSWNSNILRKFESSGALLWSVVLQGVAVWWMIIDGELIVVGERFIEKLNPSDGSQIDLATFDSLLPPVNTSTFASVQAVNISVANLPTLLSLADLSAEGAELVMDFGDANYFGPAPTLAVYTHWELGPIRLLMAAGAGGGHGVGSTTQLQANADASLELHSKEGRRFQDGNTNPSTYTPTGDGWTGSNVTTNVGGGGGTRSVESIGVRAGFPLIQGGDGGTGSLSNGGYGGGGSVQVNNDCGGGGGFSGGPAASAFGTGDGAGGGGGSFSGAPILASSVANTGHGFAEVQPEGGGTPLATFSATGSGPTGDLQLWTVPSTGVYRIKVVGAQGGTGPSPGIGGRGAALESEFELTEGQVVHFLVGHEGEVSSSGPAGGGGTFAFVRLPVFVSRETWVSSDPFEGV